MAAVTPEPNTCWVCACGTEQGTLHRMPDPCTCVSSGYIHDDCMKTMITSRSVGNRMVYAANSSLIRVFHKHAPCGKEIHLGSFEVPSYHRFLLEVWRSLLLSIIASDAAQLFGIMCFTFAAWLLLEALWTNILFSTLVIAALFAPLTSPEVVCTKSDRARLWFAIFAFFGLCRLSGWMPMAHALTPLVALAIRFILYEVHTAWLLRLCETSRAKIQLPLASQ